MQYSIPMNQSFGSWQGQTFTYDAKAIIEQVCSQTSIQMFNWAAAVLLLLLVTIIMMIYLFSLYEKRMPREPTNERTMWYVLILAQWVTLFLLASVVYYLYLLKGGG